MTQIAHVRVSAPSRLHFGLLAFGRGHERQFGGVGVMIDTPRMVLTARHAEQLTAQGPFRERVLQVANRVLEHLGQSEIGVEFVVHEAPRAHVGLGTGTQLGLCVTRALFALLGREADVSELAQAAERGIRSAIGTHGFARGGLIFEQGKLAEESISPLTTHVALPTDWRFMLLIPGESEGLSGQHERDAFDRLPPVPLKTSRELLEIASKEIVPAAQRADFDAFSDAVYRYGTLAGMCFAEQQSGAFATPQTAQTVAALREAGICGVGQSSWGPTVFALIKAANTDCALQLGRSLMSSAGSDVLLVAPSASGAHVEAGTS